MNFGSIIYLIQQHIIEKGRILLLLSVGGHIGYRHMGNPPPPIPRVH